MSQPQEKCDYCKKPYHPDPRTAHHQKACHRKRCQKQRKAASNAKFAKDNPDYFKGRYKETKAWLLKHPGYLKKYRANHPGYVKKNNERCRQKRQKQKQEKADIQAVINRRKIDQLRGIKNDDIQVVMRQQIDGIFDILTPKRRDDIQVVNAIKVECV